jgi:hypothetical protein
MNEWKHKNCFYYFKIEFLFDQIDTCHSKDKMTKKSLYFIYTSYIGWKFFFLFIILDAVFPVFTPVSPTANS